MQGVQHHTEQALQIPQVEPQWQMQAEYQLLDVLHLSIAVQEVHRVLPLAEHLLHITEIQEHLHHEQEW